MKKIYFLNDTSSCHAGSVQVVKVLKHFMKGHEVIGSLHVAVKGTFDLSLIKECDMLVVNGEGSIHHNAPWGCMLLDALGEAKSHGKETFLLNCLYEKMDRRYDYIISNTDHVCAREIYSYNNLRSLNDRTVLYPDFCIVGLKPGKNLANLSGIVKTKTHHSAIYKEIFSGIEVPEISIGNYPFEDYIETYKSAEILLTGQHHAVYAAALAGIPFVPTFGNSHKIESLIEWSGLPIRVCATKEQALEDIARIRDDDNYKKLFLDFSNFIISQVIPLETYLSKLFGSSG